MIRSTVQPGNVLDGNAPIDNSTRPKYPTMTSPNGLIPRKHYHAIA